MKEAAVRMFVFLAGTVVAACGGDGTGPQPTPTISVTLDVPAATVQAVDEVVSFTVTVGRYGGYTGAIRLTLEGAPTGASGSFSPTSVPFGSSSSTLNLLIPASLARRAYSLTVRATGTGVSAQSATISLTVTDPWSFEVTTSPGAVTITQGKSGNVTVDVARGGGFGGQVDLSIGTRVGSEYGPPPAGINGTFSPNSSVSCQGCDPNVAEASTLTLTVSAAVAPGTYNLLVLGYSWDYWDYDNPAEAQLTVTVLPPAGGSPLESTAAFTIAKSATRTQPINP